ncbi:GPO family capsid scaffolding protein [Edwardsiella ictaluri]|uniref:GPO family capsid scaffolding protein n=1 Tax=Edwardsiella ictaluri TaxID=67780 RepID=UPI0039F6C3A2
MRPTGAGRNSFTSVEIVEDYLGSGKYFLKGLAVTDTPASIGTTRLQFSQENPGAHHGNVEALILTLPGDDTDSAAEQQARRGFFSPPVLPGNTRPPRNSKGDPYGREAI